MDKEAAISKVSMYFMKVADDVRADEYPDDFTMADLVQDIVEQISYEAEVSNYE